jgi:hypothetical protein
MLILMPVITTLKRLKKEDHQFEASLDYIETVSQKMSILSDWLPSILLFRKSK